MPFRKAPLPPVTLPTTDGRLVDLSALPGCTVVYAYPRTSPPGEPPIDGWDEIPGAKGCTPQSCAFRDHFDELRAAGADHVFGLSTQSTEFQQEVVERLHLPFPLLSDEAMALQAALGLPTFEAGGMVLFKRFTLIIRDGKTETGFYPVPVPDQNAFEVLDYLRRG